MIGKALKTVGKVSLAVASAMLDGDSKSDDERQLDMLSDGLGGIVSDDDTVTREEAEVAQSRGELYNTYY